MMSLLLAVVALSSRPTRAPLTSRLFPRRATLTLLMSEDDPEAKAAWFAKQQQPPGGQRNVPNKQQPPGGQNVRKPGSQASAGHNVRRPKPSRAQASTGAAAANRALLDEIKRRAGAAAPGSMDGPPPWMDGPPPWMGGPPPGRGGPPPGMGRPPPGAMEFGNGGPMPGMSGFGSPAHPFDGYGAEPPLPGREGEYEAFGAGGGAAGAGRAFVPPPVDKGRQARGRQNNFFDVPPSEFRKAYSAARAPAPGAPYGAGSPAQPPDGYGAEPPPPGMGGPPEFDGGAAQGIGGAQLGAPGQASAAQGKGLHARMQQLERSRVRSDARANERILQLERSNERLQLALSGVREREEAARRQVAELTQRLAAVEARLAGRGSRRAVDAGTASSAVGEAPAAGTTVADSSRISLPEKVDMIQERLGLAPGGESLAAAVMEASEVAGVPNEGAPLVVQVDRLMVKLFGQSTGWGVGG